MYGLGETGYAKLFPESKEPDRLTWKKYKDATFPALMFQARAKAILRGDGSGVMETGAHDMGQGAWTALAQIAADGLGLDIDQVEFRSGTSDLPDGGIAGGSAHTATKAESMRVRSRSARVFSSHG